jgi:hypothetical protein
MQESDQVLRNHDCAFFTPHNRGDAFDHCSARPLITS